MQHLEVSCAVRRFFKSLGFRGLGCRTKTYTGRWRTGAYITVYSGDAGTWLAGLEVLAVVWLRTSSRLLLRDTGRPLYVKNVGNRLPFTAVSYRRRSVSAYTSWYRKERKKRAFYVVTLLFVVRVEWRAKFIKIVDTHVGGPEGQ